MQSSLRVAGRRILESGSRFPTSRVERGGVTATTALHIVLPPARAPTGKDIRRLASSITATHVRASDSLATTANAGGDWSNKGASPPSAAAGGLCAVAAALAVTAQNLMGDESSTKAKCCGIAGVVGGENVDAR